MTNVIQGTPSADTLKGGGGSDWLIGGGGNDSLKGGGGADILDGGTGIDTASYAYSPAGVGVNLHTGHGFGSDAEGDTLTNIENVVGSSFNDTLIGDGWNNELIGQDGNDVLKGGGGTDHLMGGSGNDILQSGGFGISTLDGGSGDDTLKGGGGGDVLIGGEGNDTADYSNAGPAGVVVSLGDPIPYWTHANVSDQFVSIENLTGSPYEDHLFGDGGVNVLRGGAGQDELNPGAGADVMYGGTDSDVYYVDNPGDVVIEYAGEGKSDMIVTDVSYALQPGSEVERLVANDPNSTAPLNLTGNEFKNTLTGNVGDNVLNGGAGADLMSGGLGNDTYVIDDPGDSGFEWPGEGFDVMVTSVSVSLGVLNEIEVLKTDNPAGTAPINLVGSEWNNTIIGNNGSNTIAGSGQKDGGLYDGLDVLTGNGGGDVFVWSSIAETRAAGDQADVVTDFNRLEGDLLAVNLIDANPLVAGDQAFTFVGVVDFQTNFFTGAGQIGFFTTPTDTFILLNTQVDAGAVDFEEATIRLSGVHNVDASFFVL